MSLINIIVIAVGLSMDCFAVSAAYGCLNPWVRIHHAIRVGIFFGLFQGVMPLIGWLGGQPLRGYAERFDHWIAFILLSIVGGKMIYSSFKMQHDCSRMNLDSFSTLIVLSIATSIDALIIGFSLSFLSSGIFFPAVIIGAVAFTFSLIGIFLGNRVGHVFENRIELIGGLVLFAIGLKILLQHLL